ncbi:hypothetical protein B0H13DRAFT_1897155 [Mycena leptocephala]|nr:hypothetical protein B0H13DRAFT_1897155 [Mycena leptocephala]
MCSLNDEWKVLSKVSIKMYIPDDVDSADGYKAPCDAMSLNEADFVNVCVGFDIVMPCDRQGKTIHQVHLTMEHVLLLASAAVIPKTLTISTGRRRDEVVEDEVSSIIDDDNIYLNADLGFLLPEGAPVVCGPCADESGPPGPQPTEVPGVPGWPMYVTEP